MSILITPKEAIFCTDGGVSRHSIHNRDKVPVAFKFELFAVNEAPSSELNVRVRAQKLGMLGVGQRKFFFVSTEDGPADYELHVYTSRIDYNPQSWDDVVFPSEATVTIPIRNQRSEFRKNKEPEVLPVDTTPTVSDEDEEDTQWTDKKNVSFFNNAADATLPVHETPRKRRARFNNLASHWNDEQEEEGVGSAETSMRSFGSGGGFAGGFGNGFGSSRNDFTPMNNSFSNPKPFGGFSAFSHSPSKKRRF